MDAEIKECGFILCFALLIGFGYFAVTIEDFTLTPVTSMYQEAYAQQETFIILSNYYFNPITYSAFLLLPDTSNLPPPDPMQYFQTKYSQPIQLESGFAEIQRPEMILVKEEYLLFQTGSWVPISWQEDYFYVEKSVFNLVDVDDDFLPNTFTLIPSAYGDSLNIVPSFGTRFGNNLFSVGTVCTTVSATSGGAVLGGSPGPSEAGSASSGICSFGVFTINPQIPPDMIDTVVVGASQLLHRGIVTSGVTNYDCGIARLGGVPASHTDLDTITGNPYMNVDDIWFNTTSPKVGWTSNFNSPLCREAQFNFFGKDVGYGATAARALDFVERFQSNLHLDGSFVCDPSDDSNCAYSYAWVSKLLPGRPSTNKAAGMSGVYFRIQIDPKTDATDGNWQMKEHSVYPTGTMDDCGFSRSGDLFRIDSGSTDAEQGQCIIFKTFHNGDTEYDDDFVTDTWTTTDVPRFSIDTVKEVLEIRVDDQNVNDDGIFFQLPERTNTQKFILQIPYNGTFTNGTASHRVYFGLSDALLTNPCEGLSCGTFGGRQRSIAMSWDLLPNNERTFRTHFQNFQSNCGIDCTPLDLNSTDLGSAIDDGCIEISRNFGLARWSFYDDMSCTGTPLQSLQRSVVVGGDLDFVKFLYTDLNSAGTGSIDIDIHNVTIWDGVTEVPLPNFKPDISVIVNASGTGSSEMVVFVDVLDGAMDMGNNYNAGATVSVISGDMMENLPRADLGTGVNHRLGIVEKSTPFTGEILVKPNYVAGDTNLFTVFVGVQDNSSDGTITLDINNVTIGTIFNNFTEPVVRFHEQTNFASPSPIKTDLDTGYVTANSSTVAAVVSPTLPSPSGQVFDLTSLTTASIFLDWEHDGVNTTGYRIYRTSTELGDTEILLSTGLTGSGFQGTIDESPIDHVSQTRFLSNDLTGEIITDIRYRLIDPLDDATGGFLQGALFVESQTASLDDSTLRNSTNTRDISQVGLTASNFRFDFRGTDLLNFTETLNHGVGISWVDRTSGDIGAVSSNTLDGNSEQSRWDAFGPNWARTNGEDHRILINKLNQTKLFSPSIPFVFDTGSLDTNFTDTTTFGGNTYFYRVIAINGITEGSTIEITNATEDFVAKVTGLNATHDNAIAVKLDWDDATNAANYEIFRNGTLLNDTATLTEFVDLTLPITSIGNYKVRGNGTFGLGEFSDEISFGFIQNIKNPNATAISTSSINLTWDPPTTLHPTEPIIAVRIERQIAGEGLNVTTITEKLPFKTLDVSSEGTKPLGVFVKPDGTKLFVADDGTDTINEYDLSTPFDISTGSFNRSSVSLNAPNGCLGTCSLNDVFFKPDGTKMFITDRSNLDVIQFGVEPAWDISNLTKQTFLNIGSGDGHGMHISDDGLRLWVTDENSNIIRQSALPTAWVVNPVGAGSNVGVPDGNDIFISSNGTQVIIFNKSGGQRLDQNTLSTPFDISTSTTPTELFTIGTPLGENDFEGIHVSPFNLHVYLAGDTTNQIFQYDMDTSFELITTQDFPLEPPPDPNGFDTPGIFGPEFYGWSAKDVGINVDRTICCSGGPFVPLPAIGINFNSSALHNAPGNDERLEYHPHKNQGENVLLYDLQRNLGTGNFLSDNWEWTGFVNVTFRSAGTEAVVRIGISDSNVTQSANQDSIAGFLMNDVGFTGLGAEFGDNSFMPVNPLFGTQIGIVATQPYYFKLARENATFVTFEMFNDEAMTSSTNGLYNLTIPDTVDNLRYLKIYDRDNLSGSGIFDTWYDNFTLSNNGQVIYTEDFNQRSNEFLDTGLNASTNYVYVVKGISVPSVGSFDTATNATTDSVSLAIPDQVTDLTAIFNQTTQSIELSWNVTANADSYRIFRTSTESGDTQVLLNTGITGTFGGASTITSHPYDHISQTGFTTDVLTGNIVTDTSFRCKSFSTPITGGFAQGAIFVNSLFGSTTEETLRNSTTTFLPSDFVPFNTEVTYNFKYRGDDLLNFTETANHGFGVSWVDGTSGRIHCSTSNSLTSGSEQSRWDAPTNWARTNGEDTRIIINKLNQTKLSGDPEVSDTASTATTFSDTNIDEVGVGNTYWYRVVGLNSIQEQGGFSNVENATAVNATVPDAPVGSFGDYTRSNDKMTIQWTEPSSQQPIQNYKLFEKNLNLISAFAGGGPAGLCTNPGDAVGDFIFAQGMNGTLGKMLHSLTIHSSGGSSAWGQHTDGRVRIVIFSESNATTADKGTLLFFSDWFDVTDPLVIAPTDTALTLTLLEPHTITDDTIALGFELDDLAVNELWRLLRDNALNDGNNDDEHRPLVAIPPSADWQLCNPASNIVDMAFSATELINGTFALIEEPIGTATNTTIFHQQSFPRLDKQVASYAYKINANSTVGEGQNSTEFVVNPFAERISDLTLISSNPTSMTLNWTKTDSNGQTITGYRIERTNDYTNVEDYEDQVLGAERLTNMEVVGSGGVLFPIVWSQDTLNRNHEGRVTDDFAFSGNQSMRIYMEGGGAGTSYGSMTIRDIPTSVTEVTFFTKEQHAHGGGAEADRGGVISYAAEINNADGSPNATQSFRIAAAGGINCPQDDPVFPDGFAECIIPKTSTFTYFTTNTTQFVVQATGVIDVGALTFGNQLNTINITTIFGSALVNELDFWDLHIGGSGSTSQSFPSKTSHYGFDVIVDDLTFLPAQAAIDAKLVPTNMTIIVADTGNNDVSFTDSGLPPDTTFVYQISPITSTGVGVPSNQISFTTGGAPNAPTGLTVVQNMTNNAELDWDDDPDADNFQVFRVSQSDWKIREHERTGVAPPRMGYFLSTAPEVVGGNNTLVMSQADTLGLHTDVAGTNGGGHIFKTFPLSFIEGKDITVEAQGYCGSSTNCSGQGRITISVNDGSWEDADQSLLFPSQNLINASSVGVGQFGISQSASALNPSAGIFNLTLIAPDLSTATGDKVTLDLSNTDGSIGQSAQHEIFRIIIGNVTTGITVFDFENANINYTDNEFNLNDVGTISLIELIGSPTVSEFTDTTLPLTSIANYKVRGNNTGGFGDNSTVVTFGLIQPIANLSATTSNSSTINLTWDLAQTVHPSDPLTGVIIQRANATGTQIEQWELTDHEEFVEPFANHFIVLFDTYNPTLTNSSWQDVGCAQHGLCGEIDFLAGPNPIGIGKVHSESLNGTQRITTEENLIIGAMAAANNDRGSFYMFKSFNKTDLPVTGTYSISWGAWSSDTETGNLSLHPPAAYNSQTSDTGKGESDVLLQDGSYDRFNSTDFPIQSPIASKGVGNISTLLSGVHGVFGSTTVQDGLPLHTNSSSYDLSSSTQDEITFMVYLRDSTSGSSQPQIVLEIQDFTIDNFGKWTFQRQSGTNASGYNSDGTSGSGAIINFTSTGRSPGTQDTGTILATFECLKPSGDCNIGEPVYLEGSGLEFVTIATVDELVTSFNDTGLSADSTFSYRAKGQSAVSTGAFDLIANATTTSLGSPPNAPTGFAGIANLTDITLSWNNQTDIDTWTLSRNGTNIATGLTNQILSFQDVGVTLNTPFGYILTAINGTGSNSTAEIVVVSNDVPSVVTGESVIAFNGVSLLLTWDDPVADRGEGTPTTGLNVLYDIFRRNITTGSPFINLTTIAEGTNLLNDTAVVGGQTFGYLILSKNEVGFAAANSTEVSAMVANALVIRAFESDGTILDLNGDVSIRLFNNTFTDTKIGDGAGRVSFPMLNGDYNFTITHIPTSFLINKTLSSITIPFNADVFIDVITNVFRVNCDSNGPAADFLILVNSTSDVHFISNFTQPVCDVDDKVSWQVQYDSTTAPSSPTLPINITNLEAYWNFEETSGNLTTASFSNIADANSIIVANMSQTESGVIGNAWKFSPTVNQTYIKIGGNTADWDFLTSSSTDGQSFNFWTLGQIESETSGGNSDLEASILFTTLDTHALGSSCFPEFCQNGTLIWYDGSEAQGSSDQMRYTVNFFGSTNPAPVFFENSLPDGIIPDISNDQVWHMYTIIVNKTGTLDWYKDGVLIQNTASAVSAALTSDRPNDVTPIIGNGKIIEHNHLSTTFFLNPMSNVTIDEFSVWSRLLTPSEITTLYNGGSGLSIVDSVPAAPTTNFTTTMKTVVLSLGDFGNNAKNFVVNGTMLNTTFSTPTISSDTIVVSTNTANVLLNFDELFLQEAVVPPPVGSPAPPPPPSQSAGGGGTPTLDITTQLEVLSDLFGFSLFSKIHQMQVGQTQDGTIDITWNSPSPITIEGIRVGDQFITWVGFPRTPFVLDGNDRISTGKIPYRIMPPNNLCDEVTGQTANCVDRILYEIPIKIFASVEGNSLEANTVIKVNLSLDITLALFTVFIAFVAGVGAIIYRAAIINPRAKRRQRKELKTRGKERKQIENRFSARKSKLRRRP